MNQIIFSKEGYHHIQQVLGKRPGDYRMDPYYLRKGMADKPYFWNYLTKKWELLRLGDVFIIDDEGLVTRIPVEAAKRIPS